MGARFPSFRRLGIVGAVSALLLLGVPGAAQADEPGTFYDGAAKYTEVVNCASVIWPPSYTEPGVAAYTGYYADPDSGVPAVATHYTYLHVVVSGLGNPCGGGTYFWPQIDLPAGVAWYDGAPINCFYDGGAMPAGDCPQWGNLQLGAGANGSDWYLKNTGNAQDTWGVAQGHTIELQLPIWAPSQAVSGANATVYLDTADGNDDPRLNLTAPLYFFGSGAQPAVMYDRPATFLSQFLPGTSIPSAFGLISQMNVLTHGQAGWPFLDIATSPGGYGPDRGYAAQQTTNAFTAYQMWTDWDEPGVADLVPGKRYYWRGGFDPGAKGGTGIIYGAEQSFIVPTSLTCRGTRITVALSLGDLPTEASDVILGTPFADRINGDNGNDTICGGGGPDALDGGPGNDTVDGGSGDDTLVALIGDDTAVGGTGADTLSYAGNTGGVQMSLALTTAQATGGAGLDRVSQVENLVGGNGNDVLTGNAGANKLTGGLGNDAIRGGDGRDTASYAGATKAVTVRLGQTTAQVTGMGTDTLASIENAVGGPGRDTLVGSWVGNTLTGGANNDNLSGAGGPDSLAGGLGNDTCAGGAGSDTASSCEVLSGVP